VFESEMSVAPGDYELVMVAHEKTTDTILGANLPGKWPDPKDAAGTIASIRLVQPGQRGVFLREERTKKSGALVCGEPCQVRADSAAAVLGLVCRDRVKPGARWRVDRRLIGESRTDFPALEIDFGEERCVQVRDLIPAGMLAPGGFRYEIHAWDGPREIASSSYAFDAMRVAPTPGE
jgi:hypothetical protein